MRNRVRAGFLPDPPCPAVPHPAAYSKDCRGSPDLGQPRAGRRESEGPHALDIVAIAKGYGADATQVQDLGTFKQAAAEAWTKDVPTVLEIPISAQVPPLIRRGSSAASARSSYAQAVQLRRAVAVRACRSR